MKTDILLAKVIESLEFEDGEVVNGLYRVLSNEALDGRTAEHSTDGDTGPGIDSDAGSGWRIVMSMKQGVAEGRMVFAVVRKRDGGRGSQPVISFSTDTYMWLPHNSRAVMPLERRLPRWGHELTSWWLLEKGTAHLRQLETEEVTEQGKGMA